MTITSKANWETPVPDEARLCVDDNIHEIELCREDGNARRVPTAEFSLGIT